ncbi:MAG TPA: tetratricopeptide repeat protein [Geminicoccaceae bacterium]|jgi:hypothetical protein|nr:tetratricopeptide repeat protein [Geminicoccaceae bacterium]
MRGSVNSDEFIREVDEAVRQDRWLQLARQYGVYLIAGALAIVLGTAAGVGWRTWQHNQRLEEARRYAAAEDLLRGDKPDQAGKAFLALAQEADSGYGIIARLRAAEAEAKAGQAKGAEQALTSLSKDDQAAPEYRQLGDLLAVQRDFDTADPATLTGRLAGLTEAGAPWRYSALELQALAQLRAGQTDAARRTLEDLAQDPGTPPDLSRRAGELLASLGGPPAPAPKTAGKDAPVEAAPAQTGQ